MKKNTWKSFRKVVKSFVGKIISMDLLNSLTLDSVIIASASTYSVQELSRMGLVLTKNLTNKKIQDVNTGTGTVYPEIVIWRPNSLGSNTGQAVVVECIETAHTLITPATQKWMQLASVPTVRFNLVVPAQYLNYVRNLLTINGIANVHLQTYTLNAQGRYEFTRL